MQTLERTRASTWRRLLAVAAALDLAAIAVIGVVLRDTEAMVYAAVLAVAIALLALRSGIAGVVMIGILGFNTAAWMVPAALKNLVDREQVLDVMIPASLAAISLTGAIAAVASVVRRAHPQADARAVRIVAQVALAVLVLTAGAALIQSDGSPILAGDQVVGMHSARFDPSSITVNAGTVALGVTNEDLFWHTFSIDELDIEVGLATGGERRVTFTAPAGTYTYYCAVPGHRQLGMTGALVVR